MSDVERAQIEAEEVGALEYNNEVTISIVELVF